MTNKLDLLIGLKTVNLCRISLLRSNQMLDEKTEEKLKDMLTSSDLTEQQMLFTITDPPVKKNFTSFKITDKSGSVDDKSGSVDDIIQFHGLTEEDVSIIAKMSYSGSNGIKDLPIGLDVYLVQKDVPIKLQDVTLLQPAVLSIVEVDKATKNPPILHDIWEELVEKYYYGFWDDEGGFGKIIFDLFTGEVNIDHNWRVLTYKHEAVTLTTVEKHEDEENQLSTNQTV